jgi:hypothetical protein
MFLIFKYGLDTDRNELIYTPERIWINALKNLKNLILGNRGIQDCYVRINGLAPRIFSEIFKWIWKAHVNFWTECVLEHGILENEKWYLGVSKNYGFGYAGAYLYYLHIYEVSHRNTKNFGLKHEDRCVALKKHVFIPTFVFEDISFVCKLFWQRLYSFFTLKVKKKQSFSLSWMWPRQVLRGATLRWCGSNGTQPSTERGAQDTRFYPGSAPPESKRHMSC